MEKKIEYLKRSLLFRMSLGSKELFHSNVWAWLIERDTSFVEVFFNDIDISDLCSGENKKICVSREAKHRDIVIWLPNKKYLVIENKIKSLPTEQQLKEYSADLWDNELVKAVFTGIINPFDDDAITLSGKKTVTWQFLSYSEISKRIREKLEKSQEFNDLERKQICEYCKIIEYMNDILFYELKQNQNKLIYSYKEYKEGQESFDLRSLGIYDIYAKMRGSQFINYLRSKKDEFADISDKGFVLGMWQSFNNGKVTLDIRYSNWCGNDKIPWFVLGVQIEEYQYRFVAECNKNLENGKTCDKLYEEMVANGWFDDSYTKESKTVFGKATSMSPRENKKYNSYKNKDGTMTFIYQYYDLSTEGEPYDALFENIKQDLIKAAEIISRNFQ